MLSQPFRNLRFLHVGSSGKHILTFGILYCTDAVWVGGITVDRFGCDYKNDTDCECDPDKEQIKIIFSKITCKSISPVYVMCHSLCIFYVANYIHIRTATPKAHVWHCQTLTRKITASANICSQSWCFIHGTSVPLGISLKLHSPNKNYSIKLQNRQTNVCCLYFLFSSSSFLQQLHKPNHITMHHQSLNAASPQMPIKGWTGACLLPWFEILIQVSLVRCKNVDWGTCWHQKQGRSLTRQTRNP